MLIIGSVKVDIHKAERQFEIITFSDVDCIKGLIKYRSLVDKYRGAEHGVVSSIHTHFDTASVTGNVNQELIAVYVTLDELLAKCNLNVKQRYIIQKLMDGYNEYDLAEQFKCDARNIASTLNTVCNRIKKINDLDWKYNYIYLNKMRANFSYKICSNCKENKPVTDDFFGKDNRNKDGFKSYCKRCDAIKKSSAGE